MKTKETVYSSLFFAILGVFFAFNVQAESLPRAQKMILSHRNTINIETGKAFTFQVGFKNIGDSTWLDHGSKGVTLRSLGPSPFYHKFWINVTEPTKMDIPSAAPGEIGFFKFSMQAPNIPGKYFAQFQLIQGDAIWVQNGDITIPINVVSSFSSAEVSSTEVLSSEITMPKQEIDATLQMPEPNIRVGIYETKEPVIISSKYTYEVRDLKDKIFFSVAAHQDTTVLFDTVTKAYTVDVGGSKKVIMEGMRFKSTNPTSIFEIKSFENRPTWNQDINDNLFWGSIEIKYNAEHDRSWVINELSVEKYLEGLAESSNSAPEEFQKALAIAARTYVIYHYLNPSKHIEFTVDSVYDQVYRGYNLSQRLDNWVKGVQASSGQVVTYNDEIVITPYFSQSDGRTRSWREVWGGEYKPWLVSVDDPWNKGKEQLGHGVGMSAQGAIGLAREDHYSYEQILKHYYTGVEVKKIY